MTSLPARWASLEAAPPQRRPVRISYHGRQGLICPHALGWKNARPMVLGYRSGGQTSTGALPSDRRKRWRCLFVDAIDHVAAAEPASAWHSADNYNPAHPFKRH